MWEEASMLRCAWGVGKNGWTGQFFLLVDRQGSRSGWDGVLKCLGVN